MMLDFIKKIAAGLFGKKNAQSKNGGKKRRRRGSKNRGKNQAAANSSNTSQAKQNKSSSAARHQNGQTRWFTPLDPRKEVMLNLDVRQTGLGGASCGPAPMSRYRFDPNAPLRWLMKIEPVR